MAEAQKRFTLLQKQPDSQHFSNGNTFGKLTGSSQALLIPHLCMTFTEDHEMDHGRVGKFLNRLRHHGFVSGFDNGEALQLSNVREIFHLF